MYFRWQRRQAPHVCCLLNISLWTSSQVLRLPKSWSETSFQQILLISANDISCYYPDSKCLMPFTSLFSHVPSFAKFSEFFLTYKPFNHHFCSGFPFLSFCSPQHTWVFIVSYFTSQCFTIFIITFYKFTCRSVHMYILILKMHELILSHKEK